MLKLNATTTALVVIDLQEGILPFAGGPYTANEVVARAARLAEKCRANGSPVVMVRVGWSDDYAEALKQPVDAATPAHALPENWWTWPTALGKKDSDLEVTKRQWGAFTAPSWNYNFAAGVSTPSYCAESQPISASNPQRVTPGSWDLTLLLPKMPVAPPAVSSIRAV